MNLYYDNDYSNFLRIVQAMEMRFVDGITFPVDVDRIISLLYQVVRETIDTNIHPLLIQCIRAQIHAS